jgi:hypothetical protein
MDYIFDGLNSFSNLYEVTNPGNMVTEVWDSDNKELRVTIAFVPGQVTGLIFKA